MSAATDGLCPDMSHNLLGESCVPLLSFFPVLHWWKEREDMFKNTSRRVWSFPDSEKNSLSQLVLP